MLIFWNINHKVLFINNSAWLYILLVVFLNTILIPVSLIWMMKRMKLIKSLHLNHKKERIYPFLISIVFYLTTWYVFDSLGIFNYISMVFLLAALLVFIALVISLFWKISIHTLSIGAMSITILYLSAIHILPLWPVYLVFMISGLVGFARLMLKAHSPNQIYIGYFLGMAVVSLFFFGLL